MRHKVPHESSHKTTELGTETAETSDPSNNNSSSNSRKVATTVATTATTVTDEMMEIRSLETNQIGTRKEDNGVVEITGTIMAARVATKVSARNLIKNKLIISIFYQDGSITATSSMERRTQTEPVMQINSNGWLTIKLVHEI